MQSRNGPHVAMERNEVVTGTVCAAAAFCTVLMDAGAGGELAPVPGLLMLVERHRSWHDDYDKGIREAEIRGLPVVIHFYSKWCGPCMRMQRAVLPDDHVRDCLGKEVVGIAVDVGRHRQVSGKYGVRGVPAHVILDAHGKTIRRSTGYRDVKAMVEMLSQAVKSRLQPGTQVSLVVE